MTSVSIDRASLGLGALVIGSDGSGTYSLTDVGLGRPAVAARIAQADSPWLHGSVPYFAVREQSALPLEVIVQAASEGALATARDALDAALWQFSFEATVTEGGTSVVWLCSPASYGIANGVTMHYNVSQLFEVWTITLPVYPIPVS